MEEYKNAKLFLKTIEGKEKITIIIAIKEKKFSIFCFKEFEEKKDILKPFREDLPIERLDGILNLYETQYYTKTKSRLMLLVYFLIKSILFNSPREKTEIESKLYYERFFHKYDQEEKDKILKRIDYLKKTGK